MQNEFLQKEMGIVQTHTNPDIFNMTIYPGDYVAHPIYSNFSAVDFDLNSDGIIDYKDLENFDINVDLDCDGTVSSCEKSTFKKSFALYPRSLRISSIFIICRATE